jgi:hypothetical protein
MDGTRLAFKAVLDRVICSCRTPLGAGSLGLETVGTAGTGPDAEDSTALGGIGPAVALALA